MTAYSETYQRVCGRRQETYCRRGHLLAGNRGWKNNGCKICRAAQQRIRRRRHPEKVKEQNWATKLKVAYGVTRTQYQEMFDAQKGLCAICLRPASQFSRPLGVDHDHRTNAVRKLLCGQCNSGLGMFRDDITSLRSAIQYLEAHNEIQ